MNEDKAQLRIEQIEWASDSEKERMFLEGVGAGPVLGCIADRNTEAKRNAALAASLIGDRSDEKMAAWIRELWVQSAPPLGEDGKPEMPATLFGFPIKWTSVADGPEPVGGIVLDDWSCWVDKGET